jgi:predicted AAA+ superfamily ATPase
MRPRLYDSILAGHVAERRQMAFVTGPRQVGKTTTCRELASGYLNWDDDDHRRLFLGGPAAIAAELGLDRLREKPIVVVFDELHKYRGWKRFLKGFFDTHGTVARLLVTGSSRMDLYRRGGDSLMGRYLLYRMHPFSVAETVRTDLPQARRVVREPRRVPQMEIDALWIHGGYPEPFLTRDMRFSRRWRGLRRQQLVRGDLREVTLLQEIGQMETLASILEERSATQLVYANLANEVRISVDTARRWIDLLCGLHHGFLVRPWHRNVARSLRKEPKWFVRDWSAVDDPGRRAETFVACHLLKAVEGWQDLGLGDFHLAYIRDKEKREVDFLVVRDRTPWILVEAKRSEAALSPALSYFQEKVGAPYAFQVVVDAPYVDADCFEHKGRPFVVPAQTFLSQLL